VDLGSDPVEQDPPLAPDDARFDPSREEPGRERFVVRSADLAGVVLLSIGVVEDDGVQRFGS
jgi:hypothetical protein